MDDEKLSKVIDELADKGWCVMPNYLEDAQVVELRGLCLKRYGQGCFHRAGVGSGTASVVNELRGDTILWVEADDPDPSLRVYLEATESLRRAVNRGLYLGLDQLEAHFAVYPAGGYYKKHLDRFRDDNRRTLTAIIYLNDDWRMEDGGLLRFWPDPSGEGKCLDIAPSGGTLVTFLSDRFWHEVLPATRQRVALTGWFKRR